MIRRYRTGSLLKNEVIIIINSSFYIQETCRYGDHKFSSPQSSTSRKDSEQKRISVNYGFEFGSNNPSRPIFIAHLTKTSLGPRKRPRTPEPTQANGAYIHVRRRGTLLSDLIYL